MDIVDDVAADSAEHRPQAPDEARLLAMRDTVVPHYMVADVVLRPTVFYSPLDGFHVALGGILRCVIPLIPVLAERDPYASRIADIVVLDDPSFAPVGAD